MKESPEGSETTQSILSEMEDWATVLVAEHERKVSERQPPTVECAYVGFSLASLAARLRRALPPDLTI